KGVEVVAGAKRYKGKNLALGKPAKVSSVRQYDSKPFQPRYRTVGINFSFSGNYAVDENYGTHWEPEVGAVQPWIVIDLENEYYVKEVETIFEFTNRTYKYKIEYLPSAGTQGLDDAAADGSWLLFADRSAAGAPQSPVKDIPAEGSSVKARFVRLAILAADIPTTADGLDVKNATNGWSIFEIRIFGK
ncbi:MAG: discoidin domain-containing protein, partial [Prevotellaceae bacterium]|nr:discoidin domain-containing protein [Prevotellaceae bacterium]